CGLRKRITSVELGAGSLDDRRPLRQLLLDEGRSLLRRAAGGGIDPDLLQPLEHGRIGQRLLDRVAELGDDRRRGPRRRENDVPGVAVEALETLLVERREVGQRAL